jgi:hypothetical protein
VLDGVKSVGNAYGIAAGTGNNVVIQNSVLSENSVAGAETDGGAEMLIDTSLMSHNQTGVQPFGTVVLRNSKISFNTTGISGATSSYGNNAIFGNGSSTTPTVMPQQ